MGLIVRTDLTSESVEPADGEHFMFHEVYRLIGCSMIEIVRVENSESIILVDEEGMLKANWEVNALASLVAKRTIVGNVLICLSSEVL